ncbi:hypothetical protein TNCV_3486701 [Trichonephila clavipes]|nr:hypothetical protein TNCV_3486701 [Trichonephila clavipes]
MQFDSEIRIPLAMNITNFLFIRRTSFLSKLPKNTTIVISLLKPCTKNESTSIIKEKRLKTIAKYLQDDLVFAYTDGSSDKTFLNGGSGVFMTTPNDAHYQRVIGAGVIASYFT